MVTTSHSVFVIHQPLTSPALRLKCVRLKMLLQPTDYAKKGCAVLPTCAVFPPLSPTLLFFYIVCDLLIG